MDTPVYGQNDSTDIARGHLNNLTNVSNEFVAEFVANFPHADLIKRDPLFIAIPLTILYSFILVAGIAGNLITCWVILKTKYLHTATNYYLFSLAISDLLLLTFGLPQEIYYIWSRYPYVFGETFCVLRGLMAETSTNASVLTITAFTVERYVAICHPFFAHTVSNLSRAIKLVLTIWILALLCAIPQAMQFGLVSHGRPDTVQCTMTRILIPHSFELSTLVFFIIPMIAITILYVCIGLKLKSSARLKQRRVSRPMLSPENQQNSSQKLIVNAQPSRKILKMLVVVVITFFVCWAPFHAQRLVAMYGMGTPEDPGSGLMIKIYDIVTYISAILYYTSSTINPILYHTMSHKFRDAFKDTINGICCGIYGTHSSAQWQQSRRRSSPSMYQTSCKLKYVASDDGSSIDCPNTRPKIALKEVKKGETSIQKHFSNDLIVDRSQKSNNRKTLVQLLDCTSGVPNGSVKNKKLLVWTRKNKIVNTCVV